MYTYKKNVIPYNSNPPFLYLKFSKINAFMRKNKKSCFSTMKGKYGWCATCKVRLTLSLQQYCKVMLLVKREKLFHSRVQ